MLPLEVPEINWPCGFGTGREVGRVHAASPRTPTIAAALRLGALIELAVSAQTVGPFRRSFRAPGAKGAGQEQCGDTEL